MSGACESWLRIYASWFAPDQRAAARLEEKQPRHSVEFAGTHFLRATILVAIQRVARATMSKQAFAQIVDWLYLPWRQRGRKDPYHTVFREFCESCAQIPDCRILELGSRIRRGGDRRPDFPHAKQYVGFDIHDGPGVDVTGDAHELSRHVPAGSFDAIFSMSVFEHLAFPWKVVLEINRVLRPGGICFVSTHPVWPRHELPWDFWRFPPAGLELLFSAATGFRTRAVKQGLPAKLHSLVDDRPTRGVSSDYVYLAVGLLAEKIADYDAEKLRWDVPLASVLASTYPQPDTTH
jgi:hypothetical protein